MDIRTIWDPLASSIEPALLPVWLNNVLPARPRLLTTSRSSAFLTASWSTAHLTAPPGSTLLVVPPRICSPACLLELCSPASLLKFCSPGGLSMLRCPGGLLQLCSPDCLSELGLLGLRPGSYRAAGLQPWSERSCMILSLATGSWIH